MAAQRLTTAAGFIGPSARQPPPPALHPRPEHPGGTPPTGARCPRTPRVTEAPGSLPSGDKCVARLVDSGCRTAPRGLQSTRLRLVPRQGPAAAYPPSLHSSGTSSPATRPGRSSPGSSPLGSPGTVRKKWRPTKGRGSIVQPCRLDRSPDPWYRGGRAAQPAEGPRVRFTLAVDRDCEVGGEVSADSWPVEAAREHATRPPGLPHT